MWSATWPKEVATLAEDYLTSPITITVGNTELAANPDIRQIIDYCSHAEKKPKYCFSLLLFATSNNLLQMGSH